MHGDRVVARVERHTERGAEGRIIRILERSQSTIVGRYETDDGGLGYVVPFDRRVLTDVHVPTGQSSSAEPGEMVLVEITRWPTATRGPVGRVVEVLGRIDEPGVDTQIIIRKFGIPDRPFRGGRRRGHASRHRREGARHQGPHRLSRRDDRHDRRRARPRFRRCDHDRATAERPLLARRAHRRRVALRDRGQRARRRSVRARHLRVFHGARGAHVPVRAGDRALQPESSASIAWSRHA